MVRSLRIPPRLLAVSAIVTYLLLGPLAGVQGQDNAQHDRGLELYRELACGGCHVLSEAGTSGWFGPPHDEVGLLAEARIADPRYRGAARDAATYLHESLVEPGAYLVAEYALGYHRMPSYAHLDAADLDALVALLLEQRGAAADGEPPAADRSE